MTIIGCNKISLSYGMTDILSDVSFSLNEGEKLGVVGVNGAGKSTLFRILMGQTEPTDGDVFIARDKSIGYLEQNSDYDSDATVLAEMLKAFPKLTAMEEQLEALRQAAETDEAAAIRFANLHERFVTEGGLTYRSRCQGVLTSLGFGEQFWNISINTLSGGQKTRVALARIILSEPDIILLDEPTNHLDIDSIEWLEKYLAGCHKTVLLISHDRYFLCKVTNRTLEIEGCKAKLYRGNYDHYIAEKKREREVQEHQFKEQQKEIARIEAYIEQQRRWNRERNIIAAESRQKQLDKMERISAPSRLPDPIRMQFSEAEESGNDVLSVRKLSKAYPGRDLFSNLSFELKKRDHLFIVGRNGCGKSTLLKILCGQIPQDSGVFEYGYNVTRGYYDQENQNLNESNTVIDELWDHYGHLTQTEIRNALALFLFKGDDIFKEISVLSGGEKARITFAKLMLSKFNLLYMDEPTNHLDIMSREVLEDALAGFDGTIVAVSHDRYFIRKLASRVLAFGKNGDVLDYHGTYEDYLRYIERLSETTDVAVAETVTRSKQDYLLSKQQNAERRKAERQIAKAKEEVEAIEARLDTIPAEMEEAATDHKKLTELYEEQGRLEERMMELLELLDSAGQM
ncbi:MAG: ABC-F family ATP-binding cassette domain-containing protein [Clostridia bacterium]|nr:ABC-F family ATP-binding cassette domain-containing protein [Clostridia bacterium]